MAYFKIKTKYLVQYLAMIFGGINIICSGMHHGWTSPTLPQLLHKNSTMPITNNEGSWLATTQLFGAIFGSVLCTLVIDLVGRKRIILISCLPYFISWITIAFSQSVHLLFAARVIAGLGDGLLAGSMSMYYVEIATPRFRGVIVSLNNTMQVFGILLINILGSYLTIKATALVSAIFPLLCLVTFVWLPESPYHMIMKGKMEQARKNLETFTTSTDVSSDLQRIVEAVKTQQENTGKYLDLFVERSNFKAFGIGFFLTLLRQLSGINAIAFYAQTIFKDVGRSKVVSASEASMIYCTAKLIIGFCCSLFVDKFRRKVLLMISVTGTALALLAEGSYFYLVETSSVDSKEFWWISLVFLVAYELAFCVAFQTVPSLIVSELFPVNVKAFGIGMLSLFNFLSGMLVAKGFQITKDAVGLYLPFYVFSACCAIGAVLIKFLVVETAGKTLEDIQHDLNTRK